jgi:DNA polymerase III subunit delta'
VLEILGHDHNKRILEKSFSTEHMPHAWLFTGPKGVGKASLAENFIKTIIQQNNETDLSTHPHFFQLRSDNESINIDHIRKLIDFLNLTAFNDQYRFCLIDTIDVLNLNASNALLKILEDPPERTIFFLMSHTPYNILKTIKSRCIQLRFHYLNYETTKDIVKSKAPSMLDYFDSLYTLLKGVPGQFLTLEKYQGLDLFHTLQKLLNKNEFDLINFGTLIQKVIETPNLHEIFKSLFVGLQAQTIKDKILNSSCFTNTDNNKNQSIISLPEKFYKNEILHLDKSLPFLESYSSFVNR